LSYCLSSCFSVTSVSQDRRTPVDLFAGELADCECGRCEAAATAHRPDLARGIGVGAIRGRDRRRATRY